MKTLFAVLICFSLAGCSRGVTVADAERDVMASCNDFYAKNGQAVRVQSIGLVKKNDTEFSGVVTLTDGRILNVEAVTDGKNITYKTN